MLLWSKPSINDKQVAVLESDAAYDDYERRFNFNGNAVVRVNRPSW